MPLTPAGVSGMSFTAWNPAFAGMRNMANYGGFTQLFPNPDQTFTKRGRSGLARLGGLAQDAQPVGTVLQRLATVHG